MRRLLVLAFLGMAASAQAADLCFEEAAAPYGIDPLLLMALAMVESTPKMNNHLVHRNTDGSEDVCAMQVNSGELPGLRPYGITRATLLADPCVCVKTGTWIFAKKLKAFGWRWKAVGAYNATSANKQQVYVDKVSSTYVMLKRKFGQAVNASMPLLVPKLPSSTSTSLPEAVTPPSPPKPSNNQKRIHLLSEEVEGS